MLVPPFLLAIATIASGQDLSDENLKPVTLTGSLVSSVENYSVPGMATERPVNTARLFFSPVLTLYGISLPFSVVLSTNERSYNQPFNQFGVSPKYKWLTLHAGYRSLRFSEFTLSDATILGGGGEVQIGKFHAGAIYGRFRRAVAEDTVTGILPVYKRMGYAATVGMGSQQNYLHLNAVHAWDDTTSFARAPRAAVYPEENVTLGALGRISFLDGKLAFDGEIAGSFVTRDTRIPSTKNSDIDALALDLMDLRLSSRFNTALKLAGAYALDFGNVRLEYARVEPDYQSAGATYTQNDREDITVAPSVHVLDNTLRLGGSLGLRSDNLYHDRSYTTHRVISSASANWSPTQVFGVDAQYSNYSMSNASASLAVNDTTRVENVSESFTLTPRLVLAGESMQHFAMLLITRQAYSDRNVLTGALGNNTVFTTVATYSGSLKSGLGFQTSLQFTQVETAFLTNIIRGITVGASRGFFDNALSANVTYTLNLTKASSESATDTQNLITLAGRYRLSQEDGLELRFQFNSYHAVNPARRSYSGTNTQLQYSRAFAFGN